MSLSLLGLGLNLRETRAMRVRHDMDYLYRYERAGSVEIRPTGGDGTSVIDI